MHKLRFYFYGMCIGCINVLLGSGGGLLAVPFYKKEGLSQKSAQIHSLATILPLSLCSIIIYAKTQYVNFFEEIRVIPLAFLGAVLGSILFSKIPDSIFKKSFACFMLYGGARIVFTIW